MHAIKPIPNLLSHICTQVISQLTQNICITFIQRRPNVFDVGPTLYKCYINVLYLLGCKYRYGAAIHISHNLLVAGAKCVELSDHSLQSSLKLLTTGVVKANNEGRSNSSRKYSHW